MNQKLRSLDILKGIAVIMIIIVHNRHFIMQDLSGLRQLINFGQMGCQLFFFTSGYSLCYSWEHMPPSKNRFFCFILRRYLRLAPGFLIFMVFNLILNILLIDVLNLSPGFVMNRDPRAILANVLFLHGLYPDAINSVFPGGWYIGTAFLLYVTFPVLYTVFQKLGRIHPACMAGIPALLLLLNMPLVRWIASASGGELFIGNNTFLYYLFTNQLPCFSLGLLLYFQNAKRRLRFPAAAHATLFAVFAASCIALYLDEPAPIFYTVLPSLAGLAVYSLAAVMIRIETDGSKSARVRTSPVSRFLADCGRNSYGMYLVHSLVSWYGMKALTALLTQHGRTYNDLLLYGLVLVPSVLIIYALGRRVEKALTRIDHRLRRD